MEEARTSNKPQQSIDELQKEFERLCDEQDQIPTEGFAQVFEVLDGLEEAFTPQHPYTENEEAIDKALEITGHNTDEAFCKAFKRNNRHYKIFCVNGNTGFKLEPRIFYFIHLQNEEAYERKESSSAR